MSNVAGKAYAMNVFTPMKPRWTWVNRFLFMLSRALPNTLGGLMGLKIIHFARWVIVKRDQWPQIDPETGRRSAKPASSKLVNDYMLFCSNFNGTWDQYIDAFSDGIPSGLDLFWYSSTQYPHSIAITPFKNYIRANQIDTDYYYNATPGAAQRDIKSALRVQRAIATLMDAHAKGADAFRAAFIDALVHPSLGVQGDLGAPGEAPVASNDTQNADRNRGTYQRNQSDAARKPL